MWTQCPCGALVYDQAAHAIWHVTYPIPPALLVVEEMIPSA